MTANPNDPHRQLLAALGRIPSGLFVLTARRGEAETGMLASWVQQCSFEPPRVSVALARGRELAAWLTEGAVFTLNILDDTQTDMIVHFGRGFALDQPAFEPAAELGDRWMDQLSGGEKQRVVLARALAQRPLLLLLDEPTLHLDIAAQVGLLDALRRLSAHNRYTVIVVTHELNLAAEYADQILLMQGGRCLRVGPPSAIYRRELLEHVFRVPLKVEMRGHGRPRVTILSDSQ